jgi:hypothetical protein
VGNKYFGKPASTLNQTYPEHFFETEIYNPFALNLQIMQMTDWKPADNQTDGTQLLA